MRDIYDAYLDICLEVGFGAWFCFKNYWRSGATTVECVMGFGGSQSAAYHTYMYQATTTKLALQSMCAHTTADFTLLYFVVDLSQV